MLISLPYGRTRLTAELADNRIAAVLTSRLEAYVPALGERELVEAALRAPIGSPTLEELAKGKENIVLIASDHTRPVPSKVLVPPMLEALRRGNPDAKLTILIATGCHRGTTTEELVEKFGPEIVAKEHIVIHDCAAEEDMVTIGTLPSGGELRINRVAAEADLLISEGFIEPHFFAGFSGGRKSVLPGIAARETVYWNHNAQFIASDFARTGILEGNPIHADMIYAARTAKLAFICNVVINAKHQVVGAFAGDCEQAHIAGTEFLKGLCQSEAVPADIVITTNNGYPLDQNIYQAVKGMTAGEATCAEGGVIIMAAACNDGHGGESFRKTMAADKSPAQILEEIQATPREHTVPDQWESQILARILSRFRVVLISEADPELVRSMKMHPAQDLSQAIALAEELLGRKGSVTVIPEGISTIIR
ncbi:MAG: nickel-dependent lactate racemase [Oscillospiraceae bacterium]|nr:nickel-dependent lactate racemase [Oscillospiraceae bacterium]